MPEVMTEEKKIWLEKIGAKAFPEPVKWVYTFPGYSGTFNLSERYIEETPMEVLENQYIINSNHVRLCLEAKQNRSLAAKVLDRFKRTFCFKKQ